MSNQHAVAHALTYVLQKHFGGFNTVQYEEAARTLHPDFLNSLYPYKAPKILNRMAKAAKPCLTNPDDFFENGGRVDVQRFVAVSKNLLAHTGDYQLSRYGEKVRSLRLPELSKFDVAWSNMTGWTWVMPDNDHEAAYVTAGLREQLIMTHLLRKKPDQDWFINYTLSPNPPSSILFEADVAAFEACVVDLFVTR